ncbi:MAG: ABC transporter ATP-binding protein [Desulfamplus sp.]|nr:ABC transporter ATP-binding protein [Desulfamplus sp.]
MIELTNIFKQYQIAGSSVPVLKNIDLSIESGEFLAIMGPSGSGKSTLLHILGCLDRPTSGTYYLENKNIFEASDKELSSFRATHIGFVFQNFNLIPVLNVFENVELPFLYSHSENKDDFIRQLSFTKTPQLNKKSKSKIESNLEQQRQIDKKERVIEVIRQVGLADRLKHKPSELSGGEMQRVAIARAMVMNPKMILADEPTGNLDSKTGQEILDLFKIFHNAGGTVIMITHDTEVALHAQKCLQMRDGQLVNS